MSEFILRIQTDNAAFNENEGNLGTELARILRDVATRIDGASDLALGDARDINGNRVGGWVNVGD
jgi:hypothetical protein